jgi:hypothetical protein
VDPTDNFANDEQGRLPFVDEHAIRIAAPRELVWPALQRHVAASLRMAGPLAKILGTEPPTGFEVVDSRPTERLTLAGSHRFSKYLLVFEVADASDGGTQLRAKTYAEFPGVRGRVYRALVIGTRAHVAATNHILRSVRRLSLELTSAGDPMA